MKPAPFAYAAPDRLDEALALPDAHGDEAQILAGGQSLVPLLDLRMARPAMLVDINRIADLAELAETERELRVGAGVRYAALLRHTAVLPCWNVVALGLREAVHPGIRNCGTPCGSLALADPAPEARLFRDGGSARPGAPSRGHAAGPRSGRSGARRGCSCYGHGGNRRGGLARLRRCLEAASRRCAQGAGAGSARPSRGGMMTATGQDEAQHDILVQVKGESIGARVPARLSLVDWLHGELALTGSHVGCEHGVCGACTVVLDGTRVRGCLLFAVQADGAVVETIEGATASGRLATLQDAFHARAALQSGFCTPGMLLTAAELLAGEEILDRDMIREALSGNYCRCTGYEAIVDAILAAAQSRER